MIAALIYFILSSAQLVGPLTLAPTDPGVLERVAQRRVNWQQVPENWADYDTLAGVADCSLVGRSGYLIGDEVYTVAIVDCAKPEHVERAKWMIDVNQELSGEGVLILWGN